ncbi:MAG: NAD(P)/FAD-dependent oxidoreductase [Steroidobacterales bacterium]
MSSSDSVVIVGAGHAGGTAAVFLRQFGFAGAITLIGEESLAPYQRPPLSKTWLKGDARVESLLLRPLDFYAQHAIGLRLGVRVEAIDRAAKSVRLGDGEQVPYDRLVLATGRRARRLNVPGADLDGVLELRTVADADRLKAMLGVPGRRLVVIGGGYIGLEAAAAARALGAAVTVIEKEPRVLARVACELLSRFYQDYHREHGVVFELGCGVDSIEGRDGHASGVRLSDGRRVEADAVLVGVGGVANDELARAAGLDCANGIRVDLSARTSDPAIHAIGDCSYRPLPHYHRDGVLESVQNAMEQARQAACDIAGRPMPPPEVPWFWSDQYDLKLQIAGLAHDVVQTVVRGEPLAGAGRARFAVFHLSADRRVQAVEAINAVSEFMTGKQLIASRKPVDVARLADPGQAMKDVVA